MSNYGDQFMTCPNCGGRAECEAVDVGVGLYLSGDYVCKVCEWESDGPDDFGFIETDDRDTLPLEGYEK